MNDTMVLMAKCFDDLYKKKILTVSWLSGLLSAEIFISTGEWGVQMPPLTAENSHFQEAAPGNGLCDVILIMMTCQHCLIWLQISINAGITGSNKAIEASGLIVGLILRAIDKERERLVIPREGNVLQLWDNSTEWRRKSSKTTVSQ